jgi:hypothetical protein
MSLGVAFAVQIKVITQTSCISDHTEAFSGCPNCATIQHGYQCLAMEKTQATDVIG